MNARLRKGLFLYLFDWGLIREEMVRSKLAILGLDGFSDWESVWRKVSPRSLLGCISESSSANSSIVIFRRNHKLWSCGEAPETSRAGETEHTA